VGQVAIPAPAREVRATAPVAVHKALARRVQALREVLLRAELLHLGHQAAVHHKVAVRRADLPELAEAPKARAQTEMEAAAVQPTPPQALGPRAAHPNSNMRPMVTWETSVR